MNLRRLLLVTAILFASNGVVALTRPAVQLSFYGVIADPGVEYMARWAGLGSLVLGLLSLAARKVTDRKAQRAIVISLMIYFAAGAGISLLGTLSGLMSTMGWLLVVVYLLFAIAYSSLLVREFGRLE